MLCVVGGPPEPISVPAFALIGAQKTIAGSVIGGRPTIREMLEFAARHGVAAKTELRPMGEAERRPRPRPRGPRALPRGARGLSAGA